MAFGDCFRGYAQPYPAYGQQPVHRDDFYNQCTPHYVYNSRTGQYHTIYSYNGVEVLGRPDGRITNSWYAGYGVDPASGGPVEWDHVYEPRIDEWIPRPVGSRPFGTTRHHVPNKLTKQQYRDVAAWTRETEKRRERELRRQGQGHSGGARGDTHVHHHLHLGPTYVVDSSGQATRGSGSSGFRKFVRFFGLSPRS
jgi:hypothetical protein